MDAASEYRPQGTDSFLAGLQAGMLGVLAMLAWLGVSSTWQRRSFWTAENLLASGFPGGPALRADFNTGTLYGVAIYLLLYSLLGAFFAIAIQVTAAPGRPRPARLTLTGIVFAMVWYYLSFGLIWKNLMPLVYLLHADRATMVGHLIYGAILGRFPAYIHSSQPPALEGGRPEPEQSGAPSEPSAPSEPMAGAPVETGSGPSGL